MRGTKQRDRCQRGVCTPPPRQGEGGAGEMRVRCELVLVQARRTPCQGPGERARGPRPRLEGGTGLRPAPACHVPSSRHRLTARTARASFLLAGRDPSAPSPSPSGQWPGRELSQGPFPAAGSPWTDRHLPRGAQPASHVLWDSGPAPRRRPPAWAAPRLNYILRVCLQRRGAAPPVTAGHAPPPGCPYRPLRASTCPLVGQKHLEAGGCASFSSLDPRKSTIRDTQLASLCPGRRGLLGAEMGTWHGASSSRGPAAGPERSTGDCNPRAWPRDRFLTNTPAFGYTEQRTAVSTEPADGPRAEDEGPRGPLRPGRGECPWDCDRRFSVRPTSRSRRP